MDVTTLGKALIEEFFAPHRTEPERRRFDFALPGQNHVC
jgi:hypothetical protein